MDTKQNTIKHGLIGRLLLDSGKMTEEQTEKACILQKEKGIRFGEAAIELGYISKKDIDIVVSEQFEFNYETDEEFFDLRLQSATLPYSKYSEKIRFLRSDIAQRWIDLGNKSILIVSPENGDGSAVLAANIAVSFSQLGKKTLLIDANLRDSIQHNIFKINNKIGLTDVLADRADLSVIHNFKNLPNLNVLTSGTPVPNPQELLSRKQFSLLIKYLESIYDIIILSGSDTKMNADSQTISSNVKGVVIAVTKNKSLAIDVKNCAARISVSGAKIIGSILS